MKTYHYLLFFLLFGLVKNVDILYVVTKNVDFF